MEASLRYPMDFTFHLQNFSVSGVPCWVYKQGGPGDGGGQYGGLPPLPHGLHFPPAELLRQRSSLLGLQTRGTRRWWWTVWRPPSATPWTSLSTCRTSPSAEFLVGFTNKGDQEMVVDSMEASLRYPMDFTFHLQNFSAINYVKAVKSKQQATVAYSFIPADAFAGRPIGLTINLHYRDAAGNFFIDPELFRHQ